MSEKAQKMRSLARVMRATKDELEEIANSYPEHSDERQKMTGMMTTLSSAAFLCEQMAEEDW